MKTELNNRLVKVMEEMDQVKNKQHEVEKQKRELQETVSKLLVECAPPLQVTNL